MLLLLDLETALPALPRASQSENCPDHSAGAHVGKQLVNGWAEAARGRARGLSVQMGPPWGELERARTGSCCGAWLSPGGKSGRRDKVPPSGQQLTLTPVGLEKTPELGAMGHQPERHRPQGMGSGVGVRG